MALVANPQGVVIMPLVANPEGVAMLGGGVGEGVTEAMVRNCIEQDLARYPEHRAKAAAIQDILIVADESVSSDSYAQDITEAYSRHMRAGGWDEPDGLHIFETNLPLVTVYVAYGI